MATRTWTGAVSGNWGTAGNWLEAAVPETGDDVYFRLNAIDVTEGLDQSAVRLASLRIEQTYTGKIGTASAYLRIGAALVVVGEYHGPANPSGSPRLKLDLVHVDQEAGPVVEVFRTGSTRADTHLPPLRLLLNDADATLYVRRGEVGVAVDGAAETAVLDELIESYLESRETDAQVVLGPGVTWATIDKTGGRLVVQSGGTLLRNAGGQALVAGEGAIDTLRIEDGTVYPESLGTITLLECRGGLTDLYLSRRPRTVTETKLWPGAMLRYDPAVVTMTAPPALQEAGLIGAQEP